MCYSVMVVYVEGGVGESSMYPLYTVYVGERFFYLFRSASSTRRVGVKMEDFDRKLSETDAYLQLLIDQNKVLQTKVITESYEGQGGSYPLAPPPLASQ